jgi:hypothetical protein
MGYIALILSASSSSQLFKPPIQFSVYNLGAGATENTASNKYSIVACATVRGFTVS